MEHFKTANENAPEGLKNYQLDNSNVTSVPGAVQDALEGKKICFLVTGGGLMEFLKIGKAEIEGWDTLRYLGENNDPRGVGSSSVIPSWYKQEASNPAMLSAVISYNLALIQEQLRKQSQNENPTMQIFRMENIS